MRTTNGVKDILQGRIITECTGFPVSTRSESALCQLSAHWSAGEGGAARQKREIV